MTYKLSDVIDFVEKNGKGDKLLSTEYKGVGEDLEFLCARCGEKYYMDYTHFKRGQRCKKCGLKESGEKQRLDYQTVFETFKNSNLILLDKNYSHSNGQLKYRCAVCRYEDYITYSDVKNGYGCKRCGKEKQKKTRRMNIAKSDDNLTITHPDLIKEWHPTKNDNKKPENYSKGSKEKIWWICPNGHEYSAVIQSRTLRNSGCLICTGKIATPERNLLVCYPNIAKEWDYKHNKKKPEEYPPYSGKFVWWICSFCGYEYESPIDRRTVQGSGCDRCSASQGERLIETYLIKNKIKYESEYKISECKNIFPLPFDFAIWKDNIFWLCEFQGMQHYEVSDYFGGEEGFIKRQESDKIKKDYCDKNNIKLILIPYWEKQNIEKILEEKLCVNLQGKEVYA